MTEQEALDFIHSIERFGSKPGLRRIAMLLERMGNPHKRLRFVHVAGTNGKGSTSTMLSYILVEAGYRTGLYISPFVLDFRERIQLNNTMIPAEDLAECTAVVKAHWDALNAIGEPPTEFEVVVAVAMEYFVRQKCDVVVLEVGMGGRFDATNVIDTPLCSVITSIGIDHVQYLGHTLEEIAAEKCGIIKQGGITVSYAPQEPEALTVIMETCAERENRLLLPNPASAELLSEKITGSIVRVGEEEYCLPLAGRHQVHNLLAVLEAVTALRMSGLELPPAKVQSGLAKTRFPARLEVLAQKPLILLDGAHNASGARALAQALSLCAGRPIHAVAGMVSDKEVEQVLGEILPLCQSVVTVASTNPRAVPAGELAALASRYCRDAKPCDDYRQALQTAYRRCGAESVLLIFGSFYLAADLRPLALELSKKQ